MIQQKETFSSSAKTKSMSKKLVALKALEHLDKLFTNFREEFGRIEIIKQEEQVEIKKHMSIMKKKRMQQNFNQNTWRSGGHNSPRGGGNMMNESFGYDNNFGNRGNIGGGNNSFGNR